MAELRALLLAVVLGVVWRSGSTSGSFPESVAVKRPLPSSFSMTSCVEPTAIVSFYEITVKGSDSDAVYRRITVKGESFMFALNETIDFGATDMNKCVKVVAAEGLAAFSYNGSCTGYRLQASFLRCATGGEVVLYVRTDQLVDEASVVPFAEAPRKLMEDRSDPYYMFMALDVIHLEQEFINAYSLFSLGSNKFTVAREKGDFIEMFFGLMDGQNCFINNANGVPLYAEDETVEEITDIFAISDYFLNECGKTVQVNMSAVRYLLYSHAGVGCTHYPADAPDECTVTLGFERTAIAFYPFKSNDNSECSEMDYNITMWSTTSVETETHKSCIQRDMFNLNTKKNYDRMTISAVKRPLMQEIGFVVEFF